MVPDMKLGHIDPWEVKKHCMAESLNLSDLPWISSPGNTDYHDTDRLARQVPSSDAVAIAAVSIAAIITVNYILSDSH